MVKIPGRFERVAAAFQEAGGRVRLCESSGSEHSPENLTDLSDLVKSFMEREDHDTLSVLETDQTTKGLEDQNVESDSNWSDSEARDTLKTLFGSMENDNDGGLKQKIRAEAEYFACGFVGDWSSSQRGFKRSLMTHLRERGFDAGLCKTKWEKIGRFPGGDYEYVDVTVNETRFIVEPFLSREFEIARPTTQYASFLHIFPKSTYVGKVEEMKQIVRVTCTAMAESMKSKDMHVPPWRRKTYMLAKWFGHYKRTTNERPSSCYKAEDEDLAAKRWVGFEAFTPFMPSYYCRVGNFAAKVDSKVGFLTAAFN